MRVKRRRKRERSERRAEARPEGTGAGRGAGCPGLPSLILPGAGVRYCEEG